MQRATRESVAYDFARFDNRRLVRQAAETTQNKRPRRGKKKKSIISAPAVLSYFAMLILSGIIVFNYMQVTMLTDQSSQLKSQIDQLKGEETGLRADQEKMYNLNLIEEYARDNLHMVKADESQIAYVELAQPDRIKILKEEKDGASSYFAGFIKSFNVVVEYLN